MKVKCERKTRTANPRQHCGSPVYGRRKPNPGSRASAPDALGSAEREPQKSPQAQVLFLGWEVDNLLAMSTTTELEPDLWRTVIRRIRAHARPSASAKLTGFYSTMKPNRNRRN